MNKRIVIIGATSAIASHCARLWLEEGPVDLVLVGRDAGRTTALRDGLRERWPDAAIEAVVTDFHDEMEIAGLASRLAAAAPIDIVLVAHGTLPGQAGCQSDLHQCRSALEVNGVSPVLFAEAFARHLQQADRGALALLGSLAGDRGRKSNYVYGAAKAMLERYSQGLQHRFAGSGVRVILVKPGPIDTPMTAAAKARGTRVAPVEGAARDIVRAIARGQAVVYTPGRWRYIMLALTHLPARIFHRLDI